MGAIQQGLPDLKNTNKTSGAEGIEKYALIAGQHIELPTDARFYFQDKRGCWFWSTRKPRVKDGDWTPNKSPVQVSTEKGFHRCLITPSTSSRPESWQDTVMRVINLENLPLAMAQRFGSLSA